MNKTYYSMTQMNRTSWQKYLTWILRNNLIIWAINGAVLVILVLSGSSLSDVVYSSYFSKITLLETGLVLIIGGAIAYSGSVLPGKAKEQILKTGESWSMEKLKKSEKRANLYILLSIILFMESLLISLSGF